MLGFFARSFTFLRSLRLVVLLAFLSWARYLVICPDGRLGLCTAGLQNSQTKRLERRK
jgi:hypothetical protein